MIIYKNTKQTLLALHQPSLWYASTLSISSKLFVSSGFSDGGWGRILSLDTLSWSLFVFFFLSWNSVEYSTFTISTPLRISVFNTFYGYHFRPDAISTFSPTSKRVWTLLSSVCYYLDSMISVHFDISCIFNFNFEN